MSTLFECCRDGSCDSLSLLEDLGMTGGGLGRLNLFWFSFFEGRLGLISGGRFETT